MLAAASPGGRLVLPARLHRRELTDGWRGGQGSEALCASVRGYGPLRGACRMWGGAASGGEDADSVECRVQRPMRPAMPTEALAPGVDLDRFAAAAMAEIELREGYDLVLNAALDACTVVIEGARGR